MNDIDLYLRRRRQMTALAASAFAAGENVVGRLSERFPDAKQDAIEIAYELQAGSYTAGRDTPAARAYRREQHDILTRKVLPLVTADAGLSLLDAGTGEGTGWYGFDFAATPIHSLHAVDISLRRLDYVSRNVICPSSMALTPVRADLLALPYRPRSFDLVVTMHAIEPNGGSEERIVDALAGRSSNLLCLFEPDFASADAAMQDRMKSLGYAERTFAAARALADFDVVFEQTLECITNPLNRTSVICLRRKQPSTGDMRWKSPAAELDLDLRTDHLAEIGDGASALFPIVGGIACLRQGDAVLRLGD